MPSYRELFDASLELLSAGSDMRSEVGQRLCSPSTMPGSSLGPGR